MPHQNFVLIIVGYSYVACVYMYVACIKNCAPCNLLSRVQVINYVCYNNIGYNTNT